MVVLVHKTINVLWEISFLNFVFDNFCSFFTQEVFRKGRCSDQIPSEWSTFVLTVGDASSVQLVQWRSKYIQLIRVQLNLINPWLKLYHEIRTTSKHSGGWRRADPEVLNEAQICICSQDSLISQSNLLFFFLLPSISNQGWTGARGRNKHRSYIPARAHTYTHTHTLLESPRMQQQCA